MLEIFFLVFLGKKIAAKARDKGWSGAGAVVLLVGLWFGGEVVGLIAAVVAEEVLHPDDEPNIFLLLLGCYACAALGAVVAFTVVGLLPGPQASPYDDEDDDRLGSR